MLTEEQFKQIQSAVDDEKSISAELAEALFESYKTAARLVNKHHGISKCFVCGFDPYGTEDFDPEELSRTWEWGAELDYDDGPTETCPYSTKRAAETVVEAFGDKGRLIKREAAGDWRYA